ncbi:MAG: 3-hydroxyacyl-CoA dehydrogenase [Aquisalimonadaceae bacterium]
MDSTASEQGLRLGIIGAGAMGRGIAQVAAAGGMEVVILDANSQVATEGCEFVGRMLRRLAEKGKLSVDDAEAAIGRIRQAATMSDLAGCNVVVEAVVENLAVKQKVFAELENVVSEDCIIASNTSSLSIAAIASSARLPGRIAGFHFFNPVPLMKLVEVIESIRTESWVGDTLMRVGRQMGREPVRVRDAPGFLVNQIGRGLTIESAHIVDEGIAGTVEIDRIMRDLAGFRMGPFELMDLTGLDVTHPATELIYQQFYGEPRFRPALVMEQRTQAGILGRKTGSGFYPYEDGKQVVPDEPPAPTGGPDSVWVSRAEPEGHARLTQLLRNLDAPLEDGDQPSAGALCLVTPMGSDATSAAVDQGLDASRTVAVDTLFSMENRRVIMPTPITSSRMRQAAHALLAGDGRPVTVIRDSPGFVAQRVVAMIVNIGCAIAQCGAAAPADIDKATTLALNYPQGPLAFADALGPANILRVLEGLQKIYGDPRYRPSPWLMRRARLGVSVATPEDISH